MILLNFTTHMTVRRIFEPRRVPATYLLRTKRKKAAHVMQAAFLFTGLTQPICCTAQECLHSRQERNNQRAAVGKGLYRDTCAHTPF